MDLFQLLRIIILLSVLAINGLLAVVVYKNNPRSSTNQILALLSTVTSIWLIILYLSQEPSILNYSLILIRLSVFFAVPQVVLFFLLADTLPHEKLQLPKRKLTLLLSMAAVIMCLTMTPLVFSGVEIKGNTAEPIPGIAIPLFGIFMVAMSAGSIVVLFKRFLNATGREKQQFRIVMNGVLAMLCLLILTILIPVAVFKNITFLPLAPLYTLIFLVATTYAILKHRLLDIRLVVARTISFGAILTISAIIYAIFFAGASTLISGVSNLKITIISTSLAVVMSLTFQTIRRIIEKITDSVLYQNHYDNQKLLYSLTHDLASTIDLNQMTTNLLNTLLTQMRITRGAVVLVSKGKIAGTITKSYTKDSPSFDTLSTNFLIAQNKTLIFEELPEGQIKEMMRRLNVSISITLKTEDETTGLLLLGEKASGDIYNTQDINVLEIIAPEASIAIKNAQSYKEIQKFNITLRQEIDKATKDLIDANQKLEQLDKLKDDFVSIASHELRTPMTAIRSYVWMALNRGDMQLTDKMKRYLERTLISTERLIKLVNDMLNISRIESGRVEVLPKAFDIQEIAAEVMGEVEVKAKEKNLKLHLMRTQVPMVFADPDKVHQVILNMVGNALKFTPDGGDITISFFTDGQAVQISIKDSGVGISKEELSKLFKKFGRLDNSYVAAATSGGTGLGLYISKMLIEIMHGKVWATSEGVGKGTTFAFSLPAAVPNVLKQKEKYTIHVDGEAKLLEPVTV